ncbi:hypothetical protein Bsp3421_006410 [Burkholderia sp. FERM BP-3421]|uniref:hypothetical protein n=1 Tax=Burkholderia sp. FERM BP-3421 TaxID=1494466 RepID=UPI002360F35E|nr:hypothetical protein [Burkholderia sp. FERM BP-3421]WDD96210.1 hypothetical protein Bsp3421_006410 [Burkholderia sp. FERM BP-3421]
MPSNARRTSARSRVDARSQRLSESAAQVARIRPMIACAWRNRCSVSSNGSATKSQLMPLDRTTLRRAGNRSSPWGDQNSRAAAPRPGSAGREAHRTAVFSSTSRTRQRRSFARNANIAPAFIGFEARPAATFNGILANAARPLRRTGANIEPRFIGPTARRAATFNGILANAARPLHRTQRKHRA